MNGTKRRLAQRAAFLLAPLLAAVAAPAGAADDKLGEEVFTTLAQPPCKLCHKLAAASAEGEIGPDLDELAPTMERVRQAVERGVGNMPPFGETLSKEQIEAVSRYVAEAVRR
jgi:mono/diheme cytochrome c family protein